MKIATALVNVRHTSESRSMYSEKGGDEIWFEAGLLTVRTAKGRTLITPAANVLWMEPAEGKAKK